MSATKANQGVNLLDANAVSTGTAAAPLRTDPTGTTPQPVTVAILPLPAGAATETTLATLATQATLAALNTVLTAIRDTAGVKKILDAVTVIQGAAAAATAPWAQRLSDGAAFYDATKTGQLPAALSGSGNLKTTVSESFPAGTNRLGSVRLVDENDLRLDMAPDATLPSGYRGLLAMGHDEDDKAQVLDVRIDQIDGQRRLQIEGKVSFTAPSPPPATTAVTITFAGALAISADQTDNYVIANGKRFVLQQVVAGSEGDSTEKGSCIEVSYFNGTTALLIERVYLNGFTTQVYPNTEKSRNGTLCDGNGTTKTIRIVRRRLSGASQEVDVVVRGYEYTP